MAKSSSILIIIVFWCSFFFKSHSHVHHYTTNSNGGKMMFLSDQKPDFLVHQSAFSHLLKAKADTALRQVRPIDRIVFRQCSVAADNERELAKCFVALFMARDGQMMREKDHGQKENGMAENEEEPKEESFFGRFIRTTLATILPFLNMAEIFSSWNGAAKENKKDKNVPLELDNENWRKMNKILKPVEIKWKATIKKGNDTEEKMKRKRRSLPKMKQGESKRGEGGGLAWNEPKTTFSETKKLRGIHQFFRDFNAYRKRINQYNEHRKKVQDAFPELFRHENVEGIHGDPQKQKESTVSSTEDEEDAGNISIFSPKIFSMFPGTTFAMKKNAHGKNHQMLREILSPDLLSLYDDNEDNIGADQKGKGMGRNCADRISGRKEKRKAAIFLENGQKAHQRIASIPQLLRLITSDCRQQEEWLNFIIRILGATALLDKLFQQIQQFHSILTLRVMPLAQELERMEFGLVQLERTMGKKQKGYFHENGYTFLSARQMKLIGEEEFKNKTNKRDKTDRLKWLSRRAKRAIGIGDGEFRVIAEMMEEHMEDYIYEIANVNQENISNRRGRKRRQATFLGLPISGPVVGILAPFAFQPQVNSLQLFTLYVLSPQAFIPSYSNPAMFYVQLLTPWAFLANLYSPQAFTCLCLSPVFFEANALSPQFFYLELLAPTMMQANLLSPYFFLATILSPQIMIADLLTPTFFQYKIFSPQHFLATLLSPAIASPNIFSNQSHFFDVLSPNIASPNIHSYVRDSIFIFSPEILGTHQGESEYQTEAMENVITIPDKEDGEDQVHNYGPNEMEMVHR